MFPQQMTAGELAKWILQDWRNIISFQIENNPRAVYNFIKANYPADFPQNWMQGSEAADLNKQTMQFFLEQKVQALKDADKGKWLKWFDDQVPYNPDATNWTKIKMY